MNKKKLFYKEKEFKLNLISNDEFSRNNEDLLSRKNEYYSHDNKKSEKLTKIAQDYILDDSLNYSKVNFPYVSAPLKQLI